MPFLRFVFAVLLISVFAHPCFSNEGKYGGQIVLYTSSDPKTFNDIVAQETSSSAVTSLLFEGLTSIDPVSLKPIPHLAKSWETSPDGLSWIFHLRDDVEWFDGVKFSADDVVFTFNELIYNDKIPSSSRDVFTVEGKVFKVEKIDDLTVKFTLPVKFAPFLSGMGQAILPKHCLEARVKEGSFSFTWGIDTKPQDIVGTGPFKLVQYRLGERLVFERNAKYWRKSKEGEALPYLDQIIMLIIPNPDTAILKFMDGQLDYLAVKGTDYPLLKPQESIKKFTIYKAGANFGSNFVVFNLNPQACPKARWFSDLRFRQAVAHAIDKAQIIDIVNNGFGLPQDGPMSPSSGYFYNSDVVKYDYDLSKAKALLAEAGFMDRNGDGNLEDAKGEIVEFNLYTNASADDRVQMATMIRQDLAQLGMKVNFLPLEFNSLVAKLTSTFEWEAVILGLTGGIEPHFGKNVWHSSGGLHMWHPKQKAAATEWEKRIDAIYDAGVQELDEVKRKALYDEAQLIASQQVPLIYTVLGLNMYAIRNKFGNLNPTAYSGALYNLEEIYVK